MKSYFLDKELFVAFEKQFQNIYQNGTGSILSNDSGRITLVNALKQELGNFQLSRGSVQFSQRAIIINSESEVNSDLILEECSATIQSFAPGWNIKTIKSSAKNIPYKILNIVPKTIFMRIVEKAKILKINKLYPAIYGILSFLIAFFAFFSITNLVHNNLFSSYKLLITVLSFSFLCGLFIYFYFEKKQFEKLYYWNILEKVIKENPNGSIYEDLTTMLSNNVVNNMPLILIVENDSTLDKTTIDVINHIIMSGPFTYVGALFWVVLQNTSKKTDISFDKCNFPVKGYSISKSVEIR